LAATVRANATASMPVARRPPWVKISQRPGADGFRVDRYHDALAAKAVGGLGYHIGVGDGGRVERNLVGPR